MAENEIHRASTTAPVNIAVIKYWGKRDPILNLPTNSSISVTLSQSDLHTHTTATCSAHYPRGDNLTLNSQPQDLTSPTSSTAKRTRACLAQLRELRRARESTDPSLPPLSTYPLRITSKNSFPTAAGLASSASGYAALVRAVADLYGLLLPDSKNPPAVSSPAESLDSLDSLSIAARLGSGSACRSLHGGFVRWNAGTLPDGTDSTTTQLHPHSHWPDLHALILIANPSAKATPSTAGMQATVATSTLFAHRVASVVPKRIAEMELALRNRDFDSFARLTMRDSNGFHAVCLDTDPPIFYMSDVSRAVVRCVEEINGEAEAEAEAEAEEEPEAVEAGTETAGPESHTQRTNAQKQTMKKSKAKGLIAAYTFDAGPNAVVFYLAENTAGVAGAFRALLADKEGWDDRSSSNSNSNSSSSNSSSSSSSNAFAIEPRRREWKDSGSAAMVAGGISRVIVTRVGEGPARTDVHLTT